MTLKRLASVQEQRIHPGAPIDVSLSPTPSEIARLPSGSDTGKESTLDDLLDALQNYPNSEGGSNTDSLASEAPDLGMKSPSYFYPKQFIMSFINREYDLLYF